MRTEVPHEKKSVNGRGVGVGGRRAGGTKVEAGAEAGMGVEAGGKAAAADTKWTRL